MSQFELEEHAGYLADERKRDAYRRALAEVVEPTDVVLDLGAGTGLLGYLACDAGAREVIAVDSGPILHLARTIAANNGYGNRTTHIQRPSTALHLDEPVDVVVCDQIGGLVHDAGILRYYADVRQRLLAPGGRLVPSGFEISLTPVTHTKLRDAIDVWSSAPGGLDISAARPIAANTEWRLTVGPDDLVRLADSAVVASFTSDHDAPIIGSVEFVTTISGRCDALVGSFRARLSPEVTLTNDPWSPDRFERWCNLLPLEEPVDLVAGDRIAVTFDLRPRLGVTSWWTRIVTGNGDERRFEQSTFYGSFLTRAMVRQLSGNQPVQRSGRTRVVQQILAEVDGRRSRDDLVASLATSVGPVFASTAELDAFVRNIIALLDEV